MKPLSIRAKVVLITLAASLASMGGSVGASYLARQERQQIVAKVQAAEQNLKTEKLRFIKKQPLIDASLVECTTEFEVETCSHLSKTKRVESMQGVIAAHEVVAEERKNLAVHDESAAMRIFLTAFNGALLVIVPSIIVFVRRFLKKKREELKKETAKFAESVKRFVDSSRCLEDGAISTVVKLKSGGNA